MSKKFLIVGAAVAVFVAVKALPFVQTARGDSDERYRPVTHQATMKDCGDCHMAFQPQMLPRRSWTAIMAGLSDHFGEDASLPDDRRRTIEAYLTANAGDAEGRKSEAVRGIKTSETPLRISETPYWIDEHRGEVRPGAFKDPKVGSKANCVACHRDAEKGYYEDD